MRMYTAIVNEIDEISEACEAEGHFEICAILDEVTEDLLSGKSTPATPPTPARKPREEKRPEKPANPVARL